VTRAGEKLSIDDSVHYLKQLGMDLVSTPGLDVAASTVPCRRAPSIRPTTGLQAAGTRRHVQLSRSMWMVLLTR
jgi:hypothetical protein